MKYTLLFLTLFAFAFGHAQTLPIDFEGDITTLDFENFDGGAAAVVANPLVDGINTSENAARIIRDEGAIWAGSKLALDDNLDFSVMTVLSMKVYTTAPVGTVVKFKLEGTGASVEVDQLTTVSGEWETLEWIFAGTANDLNELVFMFDFGNTGDGSENSTFYFDDVQQVLGPPAPNPVSFPVDFESGMVDSDFLNFSGANATVIPNPQMTGSNTSATVGQIIRDGGDLWAGSKILLAENLDLSTLWHITMKVYTEAPVGTRVKLELEGPEGSVNLDVLTTLTGEWETMDWNFDGQTGNFNRLSIMFDFGNVGDGSALSTFLFDDIEHIEGPALPEPLPADLPVDFEDSVISSDFTNFFGGIGTVIPNPQMNANNPSATVGHFIRSGGQAWAQSKLILTDFIELSDLSSISMMVYTEAPVGTLLKLKVESTETGAANERDTFTTVSGEWATYTWDFAGDPPVYNVLTFMLGYGSVGDAGPNSTFLFDDIQQVPGPPPIPSATLPVDFEDEVSTHYFIDFDGAGASVIGNPQMNGINLSDSVAQVIRDGGQVFAGSILNLSSNLNFSDLGFISMKVNTAAPVGTTIKLKLENADGAETEVDKLTTVSGEWETISWDFSGEPSIFNRLVFMFDFGAVGDGSATSTFLFDDIQQTDSEGNTGVELLDLSAEIHCFPNPAQDRLNIVSNGSPVQEILLFDQLGHLVLRLQPHSRSASLDVSDLMPAIYMVRVSTERGVRSLRLVVE